MRQPPGDAWPFAGVRKISERKKRHWGATAVIWPRPTGLAVDCFEPVFWHVLYDSAFFCYPLPQFAGVNLTLHDPFLETHSGVLGAKATVLRSRN